MSYDAIYKLAALYKEAIYNEFLMSKIKELKVTTLNSSARIENAVIEIQDLILSKNITYKIYKYNNYLIKCIQKNVGLYTIELFNNIVYRPSYGKGVNLHVLNYSHYQLLLHDLIHEALDPEISKTFLEEKETNFDLQNYLSEDAAQFIGEGGDTGVIME